MEGTGAGVPPTDGPAWEELARTLSATKPQLFSILRRYDIPPSEAEHLLQDTFFRFLHHHDTVSDPADWLADTLRRSCIQYQRQQRADGSQEQAAVSALRASGRTSQQQPDPAQILDRALGAFQRRVRETLLAPEFLDSDAATGGRTERLFSRIARLLLRAKRWLAARLQRRPKRPI